ncbi:MAG TPA: GNAT family N-acetyltransferase [Chloroflexota bacterium]|nr:GNAT family N-acetyltransferase [Chloroflexota bacterium]
MTVTVRKPTREDVPAIAALFGRAFDDYRRGLGLTADQLAAFWSFSLDARVEQTTVATLPDGTIAGFIVTVRPGAEERYGRRGTFRKRLQTMRRTLTASAFWRMPALFIPMGLAYAKRHARKNELYVSLVAVDPALQGKGIGQALLAAAEEEARGAGASAILLHTAASNARARAAYARAGYQLVSTVRAPWAGPAGIRAYVALRKPLQRDLTPRLDTVPALRPL